MTEITKEKNDPLAASAVVGDSAVQLPNADRTAPMPQAEFDADVEGVRQQLENADVESEAESEPEAPIEPVDEKMLAEAKDLAAQVHASMIAMSKATVVEDGDKSFNEEAERAVPLLNKLSVMLRNIPLRHAMASTGLPDTMVDFLMSTGACLGNDKRRKAYLPVFQQLLRVVANLIADTEAARDKFAKLQWTQKLLQFLDIHGSKVPPAEMFPAIITLVNLTADRHVRVLREPRHMRTLLKLADDVYTPGDWADDEYELRLRVAQSIWVMIDTFTKDQPPPFALSAADVQHFLPAFEALMPCESPMGLSPEIDMEDAYDADLSLLVYIFRTLATFVDSEKEGGVNVKEVLWDEEAVDTIMDFIEDATPPDWPEAREWSGKEDRQKTVAQFKGEAATSLMDLLSAPLPRDVQDPPEYIFDRMREWIVQDDRPDLQSVALLVLGNSVRSDASAIKLFQASPDLPRRLVGMLNADTPVPVLHSLTGLLRNSSIPPQNKRLLGDAGVFKALETTGVWTPARDLVQSIQGNAAGLVKLLVRDRANAVELLGMKGLTDTLHALIRRTNAPAIVFEATRIWVNCTRAILPPNEEVNDAAQKAAEPLMDDRVLSELMAMFMQGEKMPTLLYEALVTFLLLARYEAFRPKLVEKMLDTSESEAALEADPNADIPVENGARALARIIAPPEFVQHPTEMQRNAIGLMEILGSREIGNIVGGQLTYNSMNSLPSAKDAAAVHSKLFLK